MKTSEHRTLIIAEAGVNHNGDFALAERMVWAAKEAGADYVKFQTAIPELVISRFAPQAEYQRENTGREESQLDMCRRLHLPLSDYARLQAICREAGIGFMSTPFDLPSIDLLASLKPDWLKVPSGEITNLPYLRRVAQTGLPVLLSTGMSTLEEVRQAIRVLTEGHPIQRQPEEMPASRAGGERLSPVAPSKANDERLSPVAPSKANDERLSPVAPSKANDERLSPVAPSKANDEQLSPVAPSIASIPNSTLVLLHCTTQYPAPYDSVNLRAMQTMREEFHLPVGYSDHTQGIEIAVAAAAMGAAVIEKHFTLSRSLPGPDHAASLEPDELKQMVKAIRNVEAAMGSGRKEVAEAERPNIAVARKSIVAARPIRRGETLTEENLSVKRPGTGISPMRWDELLGTKAARDFAEDEEIRC